MASALGAKSTHAAYVLSISKSGSRGAISSWVGLQNKGFALSSDSPRHHYYAGSQSVRQSRRGYQLSVRAAAETSTYVVQKGDSLWGIATKHDLTVEKLKAMNPSLKDTAGIDVGQRLTVTKKTEAVKAEPAKAAAPPAEVAKAPAVGASQVKAEGKAAPIAAKTETKQRKPVPVAGVARPTRVSPQVASVGLSPTVVGLGIAFAGAMAFVSSLKVKAPRDSTTSEQPITTAQSASTNGSAVTSVKKPVKRAAPAAIASIAEHFPNAMEQESFIGACAKELFNLGFQRDNCIALVNTCRDEVCRPLVDLIDREFGHSFNLAGLGGLVNSGITGLKAGMSHSPEFHCDASGVIRERYIFFAFPHISIGETGEPGSLLRRGRGRPSSACGALIAVKGEVKNYIDESNKPYPADDFEYHSLKRKVLSQPVCQRCGPDGLSLVQVTKAAQEVITEDLEDLIAKTVDPSTADYAVITGVQIHSGCQVPGEPFRLDRTVDYIAPRAMYAVIRGEKYMMHCEVNQINLIRSLKPVVSTV